VKNLRIWPLLITRSRVLAQAKRDFPARSYRTADARSSIKAEPEAIES
jgi:hypothetical protein